MLFRCQDTPYNDIQHNDTQHSNTQHYASQHDIEIITTLRIKTLSIMTSILSLPLQFVLPGIPIELALGKVE